MQTLTSYSSGNGCLDIAWQDSQSRNVTHKKVTKSDAKRYLNMVKAKHLKEQHWKVMFDGNYWILVKPAIRINENTLMFLDWGTFQYKEFDPTSAIQPEITSNHDNHVIQVRNLSIIGVIDYFLRNETWIKKQSSNGRSVTYLNHRRKLT